MNLQVYLLYKSDRGSTSLLSRLYLFRKWYKKSYLCYTIRLAGRAD